MVHKATLHPHHQDECDLLLDVMGERFGVLSLRDSAPPPDLANYSLARASATVLPSLENEAARVGSYRGILGAGGS
jgi:hypothetical protein